MKTHISSTVADVIAGKVEDYYALIDSGDVDGVMQCFALEAQYLRPGYRMMSGHAEIESFYRCERVIESGVHTIERIIATDFAASVFGSFKGISKSGDELQANFADVFTFDTDGLFVTRRTYFDSPLI